MNQISYRDVQDLRRKIAANPLVEELLQKFQGRDAIDCLVLLVTTSVVNMGKSQVQEIGDICRLREVCHKQILANDLENQLRRVRTSLVDISMASSKIGSSLGMDINGDLLSEGGEQRDDPESRGNSGESGFHSPQHVFRDNKHHDSQELEDSVHDSLARLAAMHKPALGERPPSRPTRVIQLHTPRSGRGQSAGAAGTRHATGAKGDPLPPGEGPRGRYVQQLLDDFSVMMESEGRRGYVRGGGVEWREDEEVDTGGSMLPMMPMIHDFRDNQLPDMPRGGQQIGLQAQPYGGHSKLALRNLAWEVGSQAEGAPTEQRQLRGRIHTHGGEPTIPAGQLRARRQGQQAWVGNFGHLDSPRFTSSKAFAQHERAPLRQLRSQPASVPHRERPTSASTFSPSLANARPRVPSYPRTTAARGHVATTRRPVSRDAVREVRQRHPKGALERATSLYTAQGLMGEGAVTTAQLQSSLTRQQSLPSGRDRHADHFAESSGSFRLDFDDILERQPTPPAVRATWS